MSIHTRPSVKRLGSALLFVCLLLASPVRDGLRAQAQTSASEPVREELLNSLKVILLPRPADAEVLIKLRIHSGAAFDLAGREGGMALLGDALFPDPQTREYVSEELGGRLEVTTDYDTLNITLAGRAAEYERLMELLRNAMVNPQLTPEVFGRLREARLKAVKELGVAPSLMADRAVAARLFGSFPYGRTIAGTPDSLARLERADLMLLRERFLNPNNATLVIIGGVERARARRAWRQFLGAWRKSDRSIPLTFRQPEAADARTLILNLAGMPDAEVRLSARGLAYGDRDGAAARVLSLVVRDRWLKALPELKGRAFFVVHQPYALPGEFRLGASVTTTQAAAALETARATLLALTSTAPASAEFEVARKEALALLSAPLKSGETERLANEWLDTETYKANPADELKALAALVPADIQRVAARLFRDTSLASVAVGDATQLRNALARLGAVEILGAELPPKETPTPATGGASTTPANARPAATPTPLKMALPQKRP